MAVVPVWVWLPGHVLPVQAAELALEKASARFRYLPDFLAGSNAIALDPVELRLVRAARGISIRAADGLPGVIRDAKPAGYGADRLNAQLGRDLSPLELLELGVPDGVGAIEVCANIDRKMAWTPKSLQDLRTVTGQVDAAAPASRALRQLNDDLDTSAGGERPKTTLTHEGRLWLAKMQDRGDRRAMPAREFVAMQLARMAGLDVAVTELHTLGSHQVLLVERFDRAGDPLEPQRFLYASAHTVLRLSPATLRGDPQRSYLNLGDRLRIWARGREDLSHQLRELWRRMVFNALVGNTDDHPLNHGFLHDGRKLCGWHLAPAFDITPVMSTPPKPLAEGPVLSLATSADGASCASATRLLTSAEHFGIEMQAARQWLLATATLVAGHWESMLRKAAAPIMEDAARMDDLVSDTSAAFSYSEWLCVSAEHAFQALN